MAGRSVELRVAQLGAPSGGAVRWIAEERPEPRSVMKIGPLGVRMHWEAMLELGREFRAKADEARSLGHGYVVVLFDGKLVAAMRPNVAVDLFFVGCTRNARAVEEIVKHAEIADDQAHVIRAGLPVGLTSEPRILADAKVLAESSRTLRSFMPSGILSRYMPMPPAIVQAAPTPEQAAAQARYDDAKDRERRAILSKEAP